VLSAGACPCSYPESHPIVKSCRAVTLLRPQRLTRIAATSNMRRPATTVREGQAPNAQPPIPTHATDLLPWRITDIVSMLVLSARGNLYAKPIRNYLPTNRN